MKALSVLGVGKWHGGHVHTPVLNRKRGLHNSKKIAMFIPGMLYLECIAAQHRLCTGSDGDEYGGTKEGNTSYQTAENEIVESSVGRIQTSVRAEVNYEELENHIIMIGQRIVRR